MLSHPELSSWVELLNRVVRLLSKVVSYQCMGDRCHTQAYQAVGTKLQLNCKLVRQD